ncbi:hypothetical protein KSP39_PZI002273 [Platanthera zijinensis]|uniref:Uncharacterized protein n=1 Tax=Platanthera zijinensis TaxID=2320716 RepID=A0AAP0BZQ9_9ASPA
MAEKIWKRASSMGKQICKLPTSNSSQRAAFGQVSSKQLTLLIVFSITHEYVVLLSTLRPRIFTRGLPLIIPKLGEGFFMPKPLKSFLKEVKGHDMDATYPSRDGACFARVDNFSKFLKATKDHRGRKHL